MADRSKPSIERAFSFGPFRLLPAQQLLLEGESPVRLGSRALEILAALVERPGELISKDDLMARVWPDTVVEEGNLKVHVAALRRALGEGRPGHRYVVNVTGRGYRFVAPVESSVAVASLAHRGAFAQRAHNLPASSTRTIGRDDTIQALLRQLPRDRFVTIVGPGGIGKTTVALAVAEALLEKFEHGVCFVDLAPLRETHFVASALASALGLVIPSGEPLPAVKEYLRDKQMLIVLDSCEHVIEAAASLAEQIISNAPGVLMLATSREPLRTRGELVHRLSPLRTPPESAGLTAMQALMFPAVQLFVERAVASLEGFELTDVGAPVVADICRKLDGIALAIELAATRIDAFGLWELSILLKNRFRLLNQGRRTALPRHRTLAAALDWSYDFLPERERVILRRLAVFAGAFTLESANALAEDGTIVASDVIEAMANLVAKSLVSADVGGAAVYYRLLDTTRAYVQEKLAEHGELELLIRRHAEHHRDLFQRAAVEWESRPTADWLADYGRKIDDVRIALEWAFSEGGDSAIGMSLTVAAIPLWMHLSLLDECRQRVKSALAGAAAEARPGDRDQMKLHVALAAALMYARGPLPEAEEVWLKALEVANRVADSEYQLRALWGLTVYRTYVGDHRAALAYAEQFRVVADASGDLAAKLSIDRMTATAWRYLGDQNEARRHLDRMLSQYVAPAQRSHIARFQLDPRSAALGTLSNVLWLQGFPDQAVRASYAAVEDARAAGHALTLCNALVHTCCPIALCIGDLAQAERCLSLLQEHLAKHALMVWRSLCVCLQGLLRLRRGDAAGLPLLRQALDELREARFHLRYPAYLGALAAGLSAAGQGAEAMATVEDAINWSEQSEERWCMAELLRIKGDLLRTEGSLLTAEGNYRQAIGWARRQGALSWELRAATSLAQLWQQEGRIQEADPLLTSVYGRFTEGYETADLKIARALIENLHPAPT